VSAAGIADALAGGGLLASLAALAGGLISSANPCVLGTIFLLVSFVGSYGAGGAGESLGSGAAGSSSGGRRRLLLWSLAFAAGTVVAFTSLGLVAAQAGLALGLMSPRWYLVIAAITIWMGLQTLGIVPSFRWATPGPAGGAGAGDGIRRRGAWIALLLGGLAAIILSPCATPVLIAVLSLAASRGGGAAVWLLMLYGVGRAIPLVLVGVSGELVQRMLGRQGVGWWQARGRTYVGIGILLLSLYFIYLGV
jgi:cytochrome c biogenesis protein CcdA